ncbi:unnamed protein product [Gadus morhua 'NCC']
MAPAPGDRGGENVNPGRRAGETGETGEMGEIVGEEGPLSPELSVEQQLYRGLADARTWPRIAERLGGAQVGHWSQGLAPGPLAGQEAMAHQFAVNPRPQKGLTAGLKKLLQELGSGQVQEELNPCADGCHASGSLCYQTTHQSWLEEVGVSPPVTAVLSPYTSHRLPSWQTDTLRPAVAMTPQGALDSPSSPKHK